MRRGGVSEVHRPPRRRRRRRLRRRRRRRRRRLRRAADAADTDSAAVFAVDGGDVRRQGGLRPRDGPMVAIGIGIAQEAMLMTMRRKWRREGCGGAGRRRRDDPP